LKENSINFHNQDKIFENNILNDDKEKNRNIYITKSAEKNFSSKFDSDIQNSRILKDMNNKENMDLIILPLEDKIYNKNKLNNYIFTNQNDEKREKHTLDSKENKENIISENYKNKNFIQRKANKIYQTQNFNNISNEMNFKQINYNTESGISVNNSISAFNSSNNNINNSEDESKILEENNILKYDQNLVLENNNNINNSTGSIKSKSTILKNKTLNYDKFSDQNSKYKRNKFDIGNEFKINDFDNQISKNSNNSNIIVHEENFEILNKFNNLNKQNFIENFDS